VLLEHGARAANLLIADGHGSYTTQILSLPGTPSAVVCVDIDGDGLIDVVTAVGRQVLVLKNRGHAELEAPRSIDAGGTINAMCAADFDGDGRTDLALSIVDPSGVRVLFNTGSDLFTPGQILGAGTAPGAIVAEDFNGDGRPDLAVADAGSSSVRVFINALGGARDASPGFTAAASISVGAGPMGITAADLNGDGVIDIATANSGDDTATVLLNDGRAGFTRKDYEVGVFPVSIVSADLNGDGATDLIVGTRLANGLTVLKGLGKGIFAPPADITLGSQTWFAEKSWCALVADLDKDGTQDVVIGGARGLDIILSSRSTPGAPLRSPQHPNSDRLGN
jgi:hypothetical protein